LHGGIGSLTYSPTVDYLTDQGVIAFIALDKVRATFQPTDPIARNNLSRVETNMWIRNDFSHPNYPGWLWAKIADQEILARIAINDPDADNRLNASQKLLNYAILRKVADEDPDNRVRQTATARLNNLTTRESR
jgi:hypothetical protein